jgi:glutamate 5-kinase
MRVVAKIGTASITDAKGAIDRSAIAKLCDEVGDLRQQGHEVIVVSSGAVAAGVAAVGLSERPVDMPTLQAISAAGQSRLVEAYNQELGRHGLVGAQLLVGSMDFVTRYQYLHLRSTMNRLLELGCVPIVNENDAIANDELRYGDNDRIAAMIANSVNADVLVLLTDMDGVFTADPRTDSSATLVPLVRGRGSGGMASKLVAARMASSSGIRSVIARASRKGVLSGSVSDELVGTTFEAHDRTLPARKLWIAFAAEPAGTIFVDAGARTALTDRPTSLLPAGVTSVAGQFESGSVVEISEGGTVFARGLVSMGSTGLVGVAGLSGIGHVVHRDDLVLLSPDLLA